MNTYETPSAILFSSAVSFARGFRFFPQESFMKYRIALLVLVLVSSGIDTHAQQDSSRESALAGPTIPGAAAVSPVPRLVRFSGIAMGEDGKALTGTVGITFAIYPEQSGGSTLWMETQNVQADSTGHYSVTLGATLTEGLPLELFASGEPRWLGVQISHQPEQPRVALLSVPYALKAGDAATIGGLPPSAFVLANQTAPPTGAQEIAETISALRANAPALPKQAAAAPQAVTACGNVTSDGNGSGTFIAKFTTPCNIVSSTISETNGSVNLAGNLSLPGTALTASGTTVGVVTMASQPFLHNFGGSTFLGIAAGNLKVSNTGSANTAVGNLALNSIVGGYNNSAFGVRALNSNAGGIDNSAFGFNALRANTAGSENSAFGRGALATNQGGSNSAFGAGALNVNNSGGHNAAFGNSALGGLLSGSYNIGIGDSAGSNLASGSNNIYIGPVAAATATESSTIRIGNPADQTATFLVGNVTMGTVKSPSSLAVTGGANFTGAVTFGAPVTFVPTQTFPNTVSSIVTPAGLGLAGGGNGSLVLGLIQTCAAKQVLMWNGDSWVCSNMSSGSGSVASVASGLGLTGGPITSTGTLSIDPTVVPQLNAATNNFAGSLSTGGMLTALGGEVLPATGNPPTSGSPSSPLDLTASASNGTTASNQTFRWQAVNADGATPSANLDLLFGASGATPTATGLSVAPNGILTFAPNQTFPGATGTQGPQGPAGPAGPQGPVGATGAGGPQGPIGLTGMQGMQGPAGVPGAPGTQGPQGPPVAFQGPFSQSATYGVGSAVFYNGSSYISLVASNVGNQPDINPTQWAVLAQQGSIGTAGVAGPAGPTGPQGPTGTTGATGAVGPVGPQGLTGLQGPVGPAGISNRQSWNSGILYNPADAVYDSGSYWIANAANTGSKPSLVNPNWQILSAGINNRGAWSGSSNYNMNDAVSDGGSFWLAILPNSCEPAFPPSPCSTSWQLLAAQGAAGAVGATGNTGAAGAAGTAATVSVGTTTTLLPGTLASVTNSGNTNAAVFNFSIPQGAPGQTGTAGTAATVTVGTTTTATAGTLASVTNTGTANAAVLNFTIPQGPMGLQGLPGSFSGTPNYLPVFATGGTSVANSAIFQSTTAPTTGYIGIGTATPQATLDVSGTINLPSTSLSSLGVLSGVISLNGAPFIHNCCFNFENTFVGVSAGSTTLIPVSSAFKNTAMGSSALSSILGGDSNSAFGRRALAADTDGFLNAAFGTGSLQSNMTGSSNTALGAQALSSLTSGGSNIAIGINAGINLSSNESNDIDIGNIGVTGESNIIRIGIGGVGGQTATYLAGKVVASAYTDLATGVNVGLSTACASGQVMQWSGSAWACATASGGGGGGGISNVVGTAPINASTSSGTATVSLSPISDANVAAGANINPNKIAGTAATLGANSFNGTQTVNGSIFSNGLIDGSTVRASTVDANSFTVNGSPLVIALGSGPDSVYLGFAGQRVNTFTPTDFNTGVGFQALNVNGVGTTGGFVAFGNTAIGAQAMFGNTQGLYGTASGYQAQFNNTTGSYNTADGYEALYTNSTGSNNTAEGNNALYFTTGSYNTGTGGGALQYNAAGNYNSAFGYGSGPNSASTGVTNSTSIGTYAEADGNNSTAIGANAVATGNNVLVLGGTGANAVRVGIGTAMPAATLDVEGGNATFSNNVTIGGTLTVTGTVSKGGGSFKIDHPLDPANKYLYHSFVESPDMMDIYNGVATLDAHGTLWVALPDYFQALNREFRYQLTSLGRPQPTIYIAEEISGNRFKIAGGKPGGKVSWQVTGIRQDAFANAHRIPVEEDKPQQEQGHYLHPELYGAAPEQAVGYHAQSSATHATQATTASAADSASGKAPANSSGKKQ